jgi:hypothetical protein
LTEWVEEVQRLIRALRADDAGRYAASDVSVSYLPQRPSPGDPKKSLAAKWKAQCCCLVKEAPTPEGAMRTLLSSLEKMLDEKIARQRAALDQLTAARGATASVLPLRSVPRCDA